MFQCSLKNPGVQYYETYEKSNDHEKPQSEKLTIQTKEKPND
jgi:hypothetical protein